MTNEGHEQSFPGTHHGRSVIKKAITGLFGISSFLLMRRKNRKTSGPDHESKHTKERGTLEA